MRRRAYGDEDATSIGDLEWHVAHVRQIAEESWFAALGLEWNERDSPDQRKAQARLFESWWNGYHPNGIP